MPPHAELRIKDSTGAKKAILTADGGYLWLAWKKRRNRVGVCDFALPEGSPAIQYLTDKAQIEIWRWYPEIGLVPYKSFDGILRDDEITTNADGQTTYTHHAFDWKHLLTWRHVLYPAGVANRT